MFLYTFLPGSSTAKDVKLGLWAYIGHNYLWFTGRAVRFRFTISSCVPSWDMLDPWASDYWKGLQMPNLLSNFAAAFAQGLTLPVLVITFASYKAPHGCSRGTLHLTLPLRAHWHWHPLAATFAHGAALGNACAGRSPKMIPSSPCAS